MTTEQNNETTLSSYEGHVQEYLDGTPAEVSGDVKQWLDKALALVPQDGRALELGSAFGRDAEYIESQGYKVERTDATKGFVDLLQSQGHEARVLNAINDDFGAGYSLIFANAVLLHFTPDETRAVISKSYNSLTENGVLAFSVKEGQGQEWSQAKLNAPRYFCYWQADDLEAVVREAGFSQIDLTKGQTTNADWLQIVAQK